MCSDVFRAFRYCLGCLYGILGVFLGRFGSVLCRRSRAALLGPRFAGNVGTGGKEILSLRRIEEKFGVKAVNAECARSYLT